jgi:hypothetical protein
MAKEEDKTVVMSEIMYMFRYQYKDEWAPDSIFAGKSRLWVQAFNDLVQKGFIIKKKKLPGWSFKWIGVFPEGF